MILLELPGASDCALPNRPGPGCIPELVVCFDPKMPDSFAWPEPSDGDWLDPYMPLEVEGPNPNKPLEVEGLSLDGLACNTRFVYPAPPKRDGGPVYPTVPPNGLLVTVPAGSRVVNGVEELFLEEPLFILEP